jgi:hypothetical protein
MNTKLLKFGGLILSGLVVVGKPVEVARTALKSLSNPTVSIDYGVLEVHNSKESKT